MAVVSKPDQPGAKGLGLTKGSKDLETRVCGPNMQRDQELMVVARSQECRQTRAGEEGTTYTTEDVTQELTADSPVVRNAVYLPC